MAPPIQFFAVRYGQFMTGMMTLAECALIESQRRGATAAGSPSPEAGDLLRGQSAKYIAEYVVGLIYMGQMSMMMMQMADYLGGGPSVGGNPLLN